MDPDQTVGSVSMLFVKEASKTFFQQMTKQTFVVISAKGLNNDVLLVNVLVLWNK